MNENKATKGIGFFGLLQIAFIVLKLCGVINWSWWWVFCPIWGAIAFSVINILIIVMCVIKDSKRN